MLALEIIVAVVVLFAVGAVVATRRRELSPAERDATDTRVPPGSVQMRPNDVDALRFGLAFRGYRMDQVDDALDRLRDELRQRDERIAELSSSVPARANVPRVFTPPQDDAPTPTPPASAPAFERVPAAAATDADVETEDENEPEPESALEPAANAAPALAADEDVEPETEDEPEPVAEDEDEAEPAAEDEDEAEAEPEPASRPDFELPSRPPPAPAQPLAQPLAQPPATSVPPAEPGATGISKLRRRPPAES